MNKYTKHTIFFNTVIVLFSLIFNPLKAQNKNDSLVTSPSKKYGLALSGGGAKGFAHIGILKAIDSLGIHIDYITGTSMGGILGGLYGMGYSGKELEKFVKTVNWNRILNNKAPYNLINIEEKDEFDKYAFELPVEHIRPSLPSSFIEGQYMSQVLNELTFPAKHINDFSKLPIPVELTSSDIVNGGLVMQKKGSLALAIRATLAIPAVFSTVYIDGKQLVDGGLDRNFPVQEVKNMGADVVIGGYTGFRLFTKKEIENPLKLIYQTHAFHSVEDFKIQSKKTDILVNFTEPLNELTTKDFYKYKRILSIGDAETKKHLPELIKIAEEQKKLGIKKEVKKVEELKLPTTEIKIYNDDDTEVDEEEKKNFVLSKLGLPLGNYLDLNTINKAIDRVYGTCFYDRVYYTYTRSGDSLIMNIFLKEKPLGAFKINPHYDNEQSVGIVVNYTYRNLIFDKSRILASVDLAERFKAKLHYYKFINEKNNLWVSGLIKYTNLLSNDYYFKAFSVPETTPYKEVIHSSFKGQLALNYSLNTKSYLSTGIEYNSDLFRKKTNDIQSIVMETNRTERLFSNNSFSGFIKFEHNTLDSRYFFTKGHYLNTALKYFFNHSYKTYFSEGSTDFLETVILNPGNTTFYTIPKNMVNFYLNDVIAIPLSKTISAKLNLFYGTNFSLNKNYDNQYIFFDQKFYTGGFEFNEDGFSPEFDGFRQREALMNSLAKSTFSVQFNPLKNFYITPKMSYGRESIINPFDKQGTSIFGYSLALGYKSIVGPVQLIASRNNYYEKQPWRIYFSVGYKF